MKYVGLLNQIKALRNQLPQRGLRIVIEGGLPDTASAPESAELQLDLPLPTPPPRPSAASGRVFAKRPNSAKASQRAPLGNSEPAQAADWEHGYWRSRHRRRDRG